MANPKPYFESVRDVYVRAAAELYQLAVSADSETADAAGYLRRGNEARDVALETWPLTVRQDRRLWRLRRAAQSAASRTED